MIRGLYSLPMNNNNNHYFELHKRVLFSIMPALVETGVLIKLLAETGVLIKLLAETGVLKLNFWKAHHVWAY